ncbi:MAG: translocation/assembly module TamB domain-containing protein, partial [Pseudobdellovibrionaceae bacterium]
LQGQLKVESDLKFKGTNFEKSKADVLGKNLEINQFRVGDINFAVNFNQSSIEVPEIQLTNSAGLLDLKKLRISLKDGIELEQAQVKTDFIDLHEFLKLLGVGDLPLEAFLEADFDCAGPLRPAFKITCSGGFTGSELEVRSGPGIKNTIVQISSYGAQGTVEIDSQKVSYQAKLQIADDQGLSSGEISFQDGFKINYSAENFKLENFKHLAGLQLQGLSKLSGQTEGNSSTATFFVDLQGRDVLFEDFYLGEASTRISYKKSLLSFEKLQGLVDKTNYRGDLQVNLKEGTIQGTANSDLFEISSVLKVFEKIFQLPFEMMGTGQFTTRFSGPLRLGALSYDLDVNLNSGEALGESFDRVEFQISSNAGNAKIKKAFLQKGKARISLSGSSDPRGNLDWKVSSDQLYLEESENINRLGAGITGLIKFDMTLRDHILKPLLDLNLEVSQLLLNEQEFPSSQLQLRTTSGSLTGTADLFSGKLTSSFHFPLSNQGHFELDMTANNWNFTTLFALIGGADLLSDYQAGVTGQIKLRADTGGVFQSTGSGRIQNLFLKRGNLSVQNQGEMRLTMNQGVAQLENFKVLGDNSSLEVLGDAISEQSLGLTIRGQTQLRLLQIFVPFIEDLSGQAQLNMKVSGPLLKPQVLGDAQVKSGFAKLKGFPHPFERVESLVQFSQNKIVISSLKGFIAGGTLQGDGNISIEGPRNLPTRVTARLENVTFNVPERIRTSGRADVVFSGQWFPFTLSGSYRVNQGFIDKEFGGSEFSGGLKQSSYLPKVILQSAFEPLLLDLNVILDRPLQIKNSLMDGQVSGQLAVRGPPANPLLFGQINIEKNSKLLFRDTPFEVSSGTINFKDTKEINPELYISARTRKNEYDINLLVQGTAKDPLLRPSSLPALSESDIFSLLALGITSAGLEKRIESAQQESSVSTAVVGDILSNTPLVKSVQEQTGFNIQISSQYDDTKNVAVRKYTVSRKVTDRVNVSASRLEGAQKSNEVKVQYQLNSNWSTVGTWESKQPSEETQDLTNTRSEEQDSTLGLDLEFKREFR